MSSVDRAGLWFRVAVKGNLEKREDGNLEFILIKWQCLKMKDNIYSPLLLSVVILPYDKIHWCVLSSVK